MAQWSISASQREERVKLSLEFRDKAISFWLSKVYINEHRYQFDRKGEISSYFGTERRNIVNSVCVVGCCISNPIHDVSFNIIRKVNERIDSQQYVGFLEEVMALYPKVDPISIVHNKYPVHHSVKVNKWLAGDNIKMSVFDSWPATSGDRLPIDAVFADTLKEFQAKQVRVHSEKDLYKEVEKSFLILTTKENYVNSLISQIPFQLKQIVLKKEVSL